MSRLPAQPDYGADVQLYFSDCGSQLAEYLLSKALDASFECNRSEAVQEGSASFGTSHSRVSEVCRVAGERMPADADPPKSRTRSPNSPNWFCFADIASPREEAGDGNHGMKLFGSAGKCAQYVSKLADKVLKAERKIQVSFGCALADVE